MKRSVYFHVVALFLLILTIVLSFYSHIMDPTAQAIEVYCFLSILLMMFVLYLLAAIGMLKGWWMPSMRTVVWWGIGFRLVLLPSQPILETDYYRYLWDGYVLSNGINPYLYSPAQVLDAVEKGKTESIEDVVLESFSDQVRKHESAREILEEVNNPEVRTIYPPFAQILFALSSILFPCSLIGWRLLVLFFDLMLIFSIVLLLSHLRLEPAMVIFYSWSPLVLKEFINTTHIDGIALTCLFLGIVMTITAFTYRGAIAYACSVFVKLFTLPLIPFWAKGWHWREWLCFMVFLWGVGFMFMGGGSSTIEGVATFAHRWESNSSLVVLLEWLFQIMGVPEWGKGEVWFSISGVAFTLDAFFAAKAILMGLFVFVFFYFLIQFFLKHSIDDGWRIHRCFVLVGLMLLCSPVCNPWYVAWCVPFLCFMPSASFLYLSFSCLVYYTFFISDPWGYPVWSRPLEYIPFFVLLGYELKWGCLFSALKMREANLSGNGDTL